MAGALSGVTFFFFGAAGLLGASQATDRFRAVLASELFSDLGPGAISVLSNEDKTHATKEEVRLGKEEYFSQDCLLTYELVQPISRFSFRASIMKRQEHKNWITIFVAVLAIHSGVGFYSTFKPL